MPFGTEEDEAANNVPVKVIAPTPALWEAMRAEGLTAGGNFILMAPDIWCELQDEGAHYQDVVYDFGGHPDGVFDVVTDGNHYFCNFLRRQQGLPEKDVLK